MTPFGDECGAKSDDPLPATTLPPETLGPTTWAEAPAAEPPTVGEAVDAGKKNDGW